MNAPFDIFRTETNGGVLWIESVATLEDAQARVQELGMRSPGEYLLFNQETGNKLLIRLDGVNGARPADWKSIQQEGAKVHDEEWNLRRHSGSSTANVRL